MAKNHVIIIRVSKSQKEQIRENAESRGFKTIADYVRSITLNNQTILERKIFAMYDKMFEVNRYGKERKAGYTTVANYSYGYWTEG